MKTIRKQKIGKMFLAILIIFVILSSLGVVFYNKDFDTKMLDLDSKNTKTLKTSKRGTIVNVPIDSRPISRSSFEYVVKSAGYDYVEVGSNYLDSMNTSEKYIAGNPNGVMNDLISKSNSNNFNTSDTTIIINSSSYFFGGLTNNRNYHAYTNRDIKVQNINAIAKKNRNAKIHVIMHVPRTIIDARVIGSEYPISKENNEWNGRQLEDHIFVKGLEDYYNKSKDPTYSDNKCSNTFLQTVLEWTYFRTWKQIPGNNFEDLPEYVRLFLDDFHNKKYGEFLDNYYSMYDESILYLQDLINLKRSGLNNIEIHLACDDDVMAPFIANNVNKARNSRF